MQSNTATLNFQTILQCSTHLLSFSSKVKAFLAMSLTSKDLPVLDQHLLPDDFPHDLRADAKQLGDGGVGVVEAVQQHLRHLPLLLPHQPGSRFRMSFRNLHG